MRIRSSIVRDEFLKGGMLQRMVHAFTYLQLVQVTPVRFVQSDA